MAAIKRANGNDGRMLALECPVCGFNDFEFDTRKIGDFRDLGFSMAECPLCKTVLRKDQLLEKGKV